MAQGLFGSPPHVKARNQDNSAQEREQSLHILFVQLGNWEDLPSMVEKGLIHKSLLLPPTPTPSNKNPKTKQPPQGLFDIKPVLKYKNQQKRVNIPGGQGCA